MDVGSFSLKRDGSFGDASPVAAGAFSLAVDHYRRDAGIDMDDLAELSGLTERENLLLSTGLLLPKVGLIFRIAEALGCAASDLVGLTACFIECSDDWPQRPHL